MQMLEEEYLNWLASLTTEELVEHFKGLKHPDGEKNY